MIKYININDITEEQYDYAYNMIPIERKRLIGRIRNKSERMCRIAGNMLALECVSEVSGIKPEELSFQRSKSGKPYCVSADIEFNISHSGNYAVCVADTLPVGVDIEQIRFVRTRIARKFCTPTEIRYVFGGPDILREEELSASEFEEVSQRLLTLWTLKEAYFKNIGTGIVGNLKSVEFLIEHGKVRCNDPRFRCVLDTSINGYIMSVCYTKA